MANALPSTILSERAPPLENEWICSICRESLDLPVSTLCGHVFCWPCLEIWLAQSSVCPLCGVPIDYKTLIPIRGQGPEVVLPKERPGYPRIVSFAIRQISEFFIFARTEFTWRFTFELILGFLFLAAVWI
jgi:hypothetical protein